MGKAPAEQFYFGDFQRDMHGVRLDAVGGWALLLCKMHFAKNRGEVSMELADYARFWGSSLEDATSILDHLVNMDVCDRFCSVDGLITVVNRRMKRQSEERAAERDRKREERAKDKNGDCPEFVRDLSGKSPPSSSSSISSSTSLKSIESYVRACVSEHADKNPKLVEIAVLETFIRRKSSLTEHRPIKSIKYFDQEIRQMCQQNQVGDEMLDALVLRRREQLEGMQN